MIDKLAEWLSELEDPDVYPIIQGVVTIVALAVCIAVGWIWYFA
jgi:hypothetical protein